MKIATKIIIACTLLCTLGVVATGGFVGWRASIMSEQALIDRASSQLISVREIKKSEIERYFDQIHFQLETLSDDVSTKDAMVAFSDAFNSYPISDVSESDKSKLRNYYTNEFGATYRESNNGASGNELQRLGQINDIGVALQSRYIAVNPNGLGNKHQMKADSLGTSYDKAHKRFHPAIKHFLEAFGYYDIFLVDLDGNIVYSVFKELDFATNLTTGPYKNTGIASVFREAKNKAVNQYHLEDFAPYYPSYEAAASFIATPVFVDDQKVGVLIFQMPVDVINSIMTFDGNWSHAGLGLSGETYLIGQDSLLRSQSRFLIEAPSDYFSALSNSGVPQNTIEQIRSKNSAIGRQSVSTETARLALQGQSGIDVLPDYRGVKVFSAYAPINAAGMQWGILTEIDESEALEDVTTLVNSMVMTVLIAIVIIVAISIVLSYLVGSGISKPIRVASHQIQLISKNNDLTARLKEQGKDEMTDLAVSLNALFVHLQNMIQQFAHATETLNNNTQTMSSNMNSTRDAVQEQNHRTESVATAVNEMSASISEVAQFASRAADFVKDANDTGTQGVSVGNSLGSEISQLSDEMNTAVEAITRLHTETNSIAEVLDVIQGIAEQTNLLALNAAIEAARAGEQGRGFAVVADEVRSLAGRTQSSTEEIRDKIEALQKETNSVASGIESANTTVIRGVDTCGKNTEMLTQLVSMLSEINDMNVQIAAATEEQRAVTDEISGSITSIADASSAVSSEVNDVDEVLQGLSNQSTELSAEISQFKYKS
ncbi:methyl-accepting chemotaxis protein [Vibrio sp. ZSDE26]|uniref:Methyl-accepting chemotaxis protein n=1 Tax=Vibrio amylolyticus TaxID=2847292 RepID=A0A9X1XIN6_9VIBR|nr:methyl-accepting chemotaxis protein [Vibrio amylolyticus]MCK6263654.1 methyl-accepting chemotaxis protein [Vibrio amylolyticus]